MSPPADLHAQLLPPGHPVAHASQVAHLAQDTALGLLVGLGLVGLYLFLLRLREDREEVTTLKIRRQE